MLKKKYPYYLANKPCMPNEDIKVLDKYSGEVASVVPSASAGAINEAIEKGSAVFKTKKRMPSYKRREVLEHCINRFRERFDELAYSLCIEAGKPIRDARGEVSRLIDTFKIASDEATRIGGEVMAMDISERTSNYDGMWKRFPIGLCSFISPFNFPLNLVAHKIAPAIAVGNPFIIKPASRTPLGALIIGDILSETDLPEGYFSILPCSRKEADILVVDERIKLLSFTGSHTVGWDMKGRAGKKKVLLELGGNAACIVDGDADIDDAISRIIFGAFYQSGQSCISVQRLYVHKSVYSLFKEKLIRAAKSLVMGDPKAEETFIGPMISKGEAVRLSNWVQEAKGKGAQLLCGGAREGALFEATLLEGVPPDASLSCMEAFGPVAMLSPFSDFDDAIMEANNSSYGLQAGIFTNDINKILKAFDELEVGGVLINDIPSFRVDHMPYGGVKDSGNTREGISFAIKEMTDIKLLAIRRKV